MADWLKIEVTTVDKPEVHLIAAKLNIDPDAVVGKLIRVWAWFDQHTISGNDSRVTAALLNRVACHAAFCEAMVSVGWLNDFGGSMFNLAAMRWTSGLSTVVTSIFSQSAIGKDLTRVAWWGRKNRGDL